MSHWEKKMDERKLGIGVKLNRAKGGIGRVENGG
jgi:hypothetical protein